MNSLIAFTAIVILLFLFRNSYYFGLKQSRFRHSPILAAFYFFAIVDMMCYSAIGTVGVVQNFVGMKAL